MAPRISRYYYLLPSPVPRHGTQLTASCPIRAGDRPRFCYRIGSLISLHPRVACQLGGSRGCPAASGQ